MQRDLILVFGTDGTGKTQYVLRNIIPKYHRILVIDAGFGDYTQSSLKIPTFETLDELTQYLADNQCFGTQRPFRAAYTPSPEEYDLIFLLCRDLGNCLLVAEECDRFNPMAEYETEYVYRGRHWGVSMVGITIQPFACPKDWRRIVKEVICFRQTDPDDIDYIAKIVGEKAYEIPELDGPDKGKNPPFPYLRWTPSEGATIEGGRHFKRSPAKEVPKEDKQKSEEVEAPNVEPASLDTTKLPKDA